MSKQKIYNLLRKAGMTEAGALGVLGNWECESNCEPGRVQGDFSPFRTVSKAYVQGLVSGKTSMASFSRDQRGFGLAQWTYFSRKEEMYHEWKTSGLAIDSVEFQVGFALKEFQRDFPNDLQTLKTTNDIYTACQVVCARFENPAVHNVGARFEAAKKIQHQINLNYPTEAGNDDVEPGNDDVAQYWPPRMICQGMTGPDVEVLQAVLKARGIIVTNPDGIFGSYLAEKVKAFQASHGLDADGMVGPLTWEELLKR